MTNRAPKSRFIELDAGVRLSYAHYGKPLHEAIPVLLLRPLGGSIALWGSFAEQLAHDFAVLTFDYRGMGDSSRARRRLTTRSLAEDALAVLDRLEIGRTHVFGISLGGMAATWLAHLAPDRLAGLVLASTAVRGRSLLGRDVGATLKMASCFARRSSRVEPCLVEHVLSPGFKETHPAEFLHILTQISQRPTPPMALLKHAAAAASHDVGKLLPTLRVPTLVLAGANDHILGLESVQKLATGIPQARFEVIAAAGHDVTLEDPIGTAARASAFFSDAERFGKRTQK